MDKWSERIANYSLVFIASLSILIGIGDIFFDFQQIKYLKDTPQITLIVIGVLALSIGVERIISFAKLSNKLSNIKTFLNNNNSELKELGKVFRANINAQFIETSLEILKVAEDLVRDAEERIYVLSFDLQIIRLQIKGSTEERDAYEKWSKALKATIKKHQNFDFRIVYSYPDELDEREKNLIEAEKLKYDEILSRCQFKTRQVPFGFALLLVDNRHLLISFPMNTQDSRPSNAIKLINNSKLVDRVANWFERCVWDSSDYVE